MDLLGGYDSNSDSDSEKNETTTQNKQSQSTTTSKTAPNVPPVTKSARPNRKGKKLLKLQSVLPDHIWNQLSNGNAQQPDSDEDDEEAAMQTTKKAAPKAKRQPGDNDDLTNLLDALPKSKIGSSFLGNRSILGQDSNSTTIQPSSSSSPSLGSAFVTSTVETVRTKKTGPSVVRDIHGHSKPSVETERDNDNDEKDPSPQRTFAEPLRRNPAPPSATARMRTAAPVVAARYQQPSYPVPQAAPQQQQQYPVASTNSKKSRKRQMEQMLREGNLDGVSSDVHLHGQDNVYEVPQDQQQHSTQAQSHGVRVVPTSQYVPGMGTTASTIKISGKQRGKNQVNALLASAASLEAQRARNPLPQQNTHRANAKRKYGW
eukprot:scaffold15311_cov136-Cylindrotheca_fusiformis.AAC.11